MKNATKRRVTVDLDPEEHRALKQYALDHDATISDVLRAALAELRAEAALQAAVGGRLVREESQ